MSGSNRRVCAVLLVVATLALVCVAAVTVHGETATKQITILHTNDFHGNLESDASGRGGSAYIAGKVNEIRTAVGAENVALLDAGDIYFGGAPISALTMGESAIDIYNMMGYDAATYGNHEFDKGQAVLAQRTTQSAFPWVSANIVVSGTDWTHPAWSPPYTILTLGPAGDQVKLGIIGLTTDETPIVTLMGTTDGIVFKDPTQAVLHYYDEVKGLADAVIVLAHIGSSNSGPYKGLKTIAQELIDAGKPIDLMIGGHSHEQVPTAIVVGDTRIVVAYYAGRHLGRITATVDPVTKKLTVDAYAPITINNTLTADPDVAARVAYWKGVVAPIMAQPVGTTNVSLVRNYNGESNVGDLVADSMRWKADQYDDGTANGSVKIAFTNAGGLRADVVIPDGATLPYPLTWGQTFSILPFANTLYLMDLTGWQIQKLLDQSATLYKGHLQVSGVSFYYYNNTGTASPTAWGAYGVMVDGTPINYSQTYRIVTNNFLATGMGDGFVAFGEGTSRWDSYYDMQQGLNEYIQWYNSTVGPIDYAVEGRITKLDKVVTILHTNDEHGCVATEVSGGVTRGLQHLSSLVKAERAKNPDVLLFTAGDGVQGNSLAYYYRNAPGATPGGSTALPNPIIAAFNAMGYNAGTFGNHDFNFGKDSFAEYQNQTVFPWLAGNLHDDGRYGIDPGKVKEYQIFTVAGMKVGVLGMTNPRVPSYELPSNIVGLTFEDGLDAASRVLPLVQAETPDLVVSLSHLGYSPYEGSGPEQTDVFLAENLPGIDVIIGGHSHTKLDPAVLVTSATNPEGTLIAQAERYGTYLGKVNIGFRALDGGAYEMILREGRLIPAQMATADPDITALVAPYLAEYDAYFNQTIGETTVPLDTRTAFYEETGGSNLQADASVWALEQAGVHVDFHLSGAMSNRFVAAGTLSVRDMFTLLPYENTLLVMRMNGPQIKNVLERSFYNYDLWRTGQARWTTCFLDTNAGRVMTFDPMVPETGDNAVAFTIDGVPVDFSDADTYFDVSTVNYLAVGSCSYSDAGVSLWPLDQIVTDTQLYVRDAVVEYIKAHTPISPQVEGRIMFASPLRFDPPQTVVYECVQSFTVDARLENVTNLGGFGLTMHFNPDVVQVADVILGSLVTESGRMVFPMLSEIDNVAGTAAFAGGVYGPGPELTGSGPIARITFVPVAAGDSGLNWSELPGDVQVTDPNGDLIPVSPVNGSVTILTALPGDMDCDCDVDIVDIMLVASRWNTKVANPRYDPHYDLDGDGDIDIVDIMRVASRWNTHCEEGLAPEPQPARVGGQFADEAPPEGVRITGRPKGALRDDTHTVEIKADRVSNLGGFELVLHFNPKLLQVEGVELGDLLGSTGRTAVPLGAAIDNKAGTVRFAAFSYGVARGADGDGTLVRVTLRALTGSGGKLTVSGLQLTDTQGWVQ